MCGVTSVYGYLHVVTPGTCPPGKRQVNENLHPASTIDLLALLLPGSLVSLGHNNLFIIRKELCGERMHNLLRSGPCERRCKYVASRQAFSQCQ